MLPPDRTEILNRLKLIEEMMAEGRRTTERWGWSFLMWGFGPLIARWWESRWPYAALAWPVTMGLCVVVNGAVLRAHERRGTAETFAARAMGAVWTSAGITVLLVAFGAALSGTSRSRTLYVALFALAAAGHSASSIILRWLPQFLAAMVWWCAGMAAFVLPDSRLPSIAAVALLLGNVAFGAWLSYRERSRQDA